MASSTVYGRADVGVRIGDILSQAAGLWSRLVVPYGLFFVVAALPNVIHQYERRIHPPHGLSGIWQSLAISTVATIVINAFVQTSATAMALEITKSGESSLASSINQGARSFLAVLLMLVLATIAIILGSMLLVVPGLIVACMWMVATPVLVSEQIGPFASLKRSAALTKGHRWKVFALFLIMVAIGMPGVVAGLVLIRAGNPIAGADIQVALTAAASVLNVSLVVATYTALSNASGGFGGRRMADVF